MTKSKSYFEHSDAVDYFKELPFYNKPIENQMLNISKTLIN